MAEIEVFADVSCPFAHVGLRRLVETRHRLGRPDVAIVVRAWPLEWVNGVALTGAFVAEEVDQLRAQVTPELFVRFRADRFPASTLGPLRLTHAAYAVGPELGEVVALEVRDRLFERGEDVADPAVLATMAAAHGLELDDDDGPVREDWQAGQQRGVVGSPHFFGPGVDAFCPALRISKVDGHLHIEANPARLDEFAAACFGPEDQVAAAT